MWSMIFDKKSPSQFFLLKLLKYSLVYHMEREKSIQKRFPFVTICNDSNWKCEEDLNSASGYKDFFRKFLKAKCWDNCLGKTIEREAQIQRCKPRRNYGSIWRGFQMTKLSKHKKQRDNFCEKNQFWYIGISYSAMHTSNISFLDFWENIYTKGNAGCSKGLVLSIFNGFSTDTYFLHCIRRNYFL